jgi:hypothetical protein
MSDPIDNFDPELAVADYRRVMAQLNAATSEVDKFEFRTIATRMRVEWKAWQGEDSLHEMAFGEPE